MCHDLEGRRLNDEVKLSVGTEVVVNGGYQGEEPLVEHKLLHHRGISFQAVEWTAPS
jgi:hypothetical protein